MAPEQGGDVNVGGWDIGSRDIGGDVDKDVGGDVDEDVSGDVTDGGDRVQLRTRLL